MRTGVNRKAKYMHIKMYSIIIALFVMSCSVSNERATAWDNNSPPTELFDGSFEDFGLDCKMNTIEGDDGVYVNMSIQNNSTVDVQLLKWETVWDEYSQVFEATNTEGKLKYWGYSAFGRTISEDDYIPLPAGSEVNEEYSLDEHFLVETVDDYQIVLRSPYMTFNVDGKILNLNHNCGSGLVNLQPSVTSDARINMAALYPHEDCNANQKSQFREAFEISHIAARIAYYGYTQSNTGMFRKWFGAYGENKFNTVKGQVHDILFDKWDYEVRCGGDICGSGDLGVTEHRVTDRIYLCPAWYSKPVTSMAGRSRVATVVHEQSHVNDGSGLWGTDDIKDNGSCSGICYGIDNSLNLAATDPTCTSGSIDCKAIRNASNYGFYVVDAYLATISAVNASLALR